ncbi:multicopper oxidase family protein [Streptomyces sp. KR80]|uniref:multicopper oxidase family protein n=1 Tax=Streptomyces sp. KR80 TaxID=3457426 RepID=UPI003FD0AA7E
MTKSSGRLKRILIALTLAIVAVPATAVGAGVWLYAAADVSTVGRVEFANPLAVPPLADSTVDKDGTRVFDLEMQPGHKEFTAGQQTPTWGFSGDYLGPTLRAERGEQVRVKVRNSLDEASTVHWHGMHLPATMDGGPHQMVNAGDNWQPHWEVDQPAATLWYHPHPHGATEKHVQRGLAGMFILDDDKAAELPLPKTYGVDDLPLIVQDVKFEGAQFDHGHRTMANTGFLGDTTMVNGTLAPYREVGDERVRLRLLNASTARSYDFGFDDDRGFSLIATDGGLLEGPVTLDRIKLSPGERAEIVVEVHPGERTVLRSYASPDSDFWQDRFGGNDDSFDILELRAAKALRSSPELSDELVGPAGPEVPDGSDPVRERSFDLRMSGINGEPMAMDRIDASVTRGTTEVWTLRNRDGMPHNFHVHDVQFRVLEVDGERPPPELRGPKDTVYVPGSRTVKIALRFDGPADPDTPYMYHCHLLYHEDGGMMGQFVVVEPGQKAGKPPVGSDHDHR